MKWKYLFLLTGMIFAILAARPSATPPLAEWQSIAARNDERSSERPLIYRALVPVHWIRQDPAPGESLTDTKKPICEFHIQDREEAIRVTLHTFPIEQNGMRIPPQAQIARWKSQLEPLNPLSIHIYADSQGGFSGLYFEGQGLLQEKPTLVMACYMQLASIYEQGLNQEKHPLHRSTRADYTIKASGPPALMERHRAAILAFAHSFELIDELPLG